MSRPPLVLAPQTQVRQAAARMFANGVGSVLVMDEGELVGIATEQHFTQLLAEDLDPDETTLGDIMTTPVPTIEPATNVEEAIHEMVELGVKRLAVELEGDLRGIVSVTDIAYAEPELARRARERMGRNPDR